MHPHSGANLVCEMWPAHQVAVHDRAHNCTHTHPAQMRLIARTLYTPACSRATSHTHVRTQSHTPTDETSQLKCAIKDKKWCLATDSAGKPILKACASEPKSTQ